MASTAVAGFLDALRQLHLLEPGQGEQLARAVQGPNVEPRALARQLVERGWLTAYQAEQLLAGRGRELLLGSYVLLERLGEGGMGAVFKARNWKLGQTVALKRIHKDRTTNETAVRRFYREIRAAAQLDHPNIVRAFDADAVDGTHLLVMEYVEGIDLAGLVKEKGPLPVAQACECVRQAARGLQHAFEKGLVHRDVKPHNLLLAARPGPDGKAVVKILDMGLALLGAGADGDASSMLTQEGVVVGTPDYIAPEQAMGGHDVDVRADLYSLGCTLYFLLTGRPPFPGGTLGAKLIQHKLEQPEPVENLRPDVTPALAAVIRTLMAKEPGDRFQTPAELIEALAAAETGIALVCVTPLPPPAPDVSDHSGTQTFTGLGDTTDGPRSAARLARRPRRRLSWVAGAAALVLLLVL